MPITLGEKNVLCGTIRFRQRTKEEKYTRGPGHIASEYAVQVKDHLGYYIDNYFVDRLALAQDKYVEFCEAYDQGAMAAHIYGSVEAAEQFTELAALV
jgi:hypothetical protein